MKMSQGGRGGGGDWFVSQDITYVWNFSEYQVPFPVPHGPRPPFCLPGVEGSE